MRVDARHLRRDVGAHAHHAARELVDHLEGAQLQVVPGTGEQRVHVLEQRRHDELVFLFEKQIQDRASQALDAHRLGGKDVLYKLRKKPLHGSTRFMTSPRRAARGRR
jgi:hypothetical protein